MTADANEKTRFEALKENESIVVEHTEYFSELCRFACEALDASTAAITLLDDKKSRFAAYHGSYGPELPRSESLSTHVVEQGTTVCVPDVAALPDKRQSQAMVDCGIQSYLAVPLTVKPGVHIGSLFVSCAASRQFDGRDIKLIGSLGRIAVSLMAMSRLELQNAATLVKMKALIAKLRAHRATLRRNGRMLKQVSHLAGIGGWELDIASSQTYWSDEVYKIHEVDPGPNFDLSSVIDFYAEEARPTVAKLVNRAIATGQPFEFELPLMTAKGNRRLVRSMGEAEIENGRAVRLFGTFQDVTERRAAEKQALQSQKMDAIGQLTGGIAHDFNNILAVIIGNLQICLKTATGKEPEYEYVAAALAAAQRGGKLTGRLLNYSRSRDPLSEPIDPAAVVRGLEDMLRKACGATTRLAVRIYGDPWPVLSDASQLETALLNLVLNARDASRGAGDIVVKVEIFQAAAEEKYFAPALEPGDYVRISVIDRGAGIPKSILDKVTEPFFTTKGAGKGTGLGLSMVHGFVTRSGGSMSIESEEGVGTTVSLFLPRLKQVANDAPAPAPLASGRVLVVDDDSDVRAMAMSILRRLGLSPEGVADADAALQFLRAGKEVDVLFSDVRMPGGMNGLQLAEESKKIRPDLKVILTSGYAGSPEVMQKIREGRFAFLPKPYDGAGLGKMIRSVLEDSRSAA